MRFRILSPPFGFIHLFIIGQLLLMMSMTAVAATPLPVDHASSVGQVVVDNTAVTKPAETGAQQVVNLQEVGLVPRTEVIFISISTPPSTRPNPVIEMWSKFTHADCGFVNNAAATDVQMRNMPPLE